MSERAPRFRLLITPVQWAVAILVALVICGLMFATTRRAPKERLDAWFPPGSTVLSQLNNVTVLRVSKNLSNTVDWFANRLVMGYGPTGASFQYRSTGLTPFSRSILRAGINRIGNPATGEAATFLLNHSGRAYIFHVTQYLGESNAIVHVIHADPKSGPRATDSPLPPYSRVSSSSTSSSGDLSFHTMTATTNLQAVSDWYSVQLLGPWQSKSFTPSYAFPLPNVMSRHTRDVHFLRVSDNTITMVYAVEKGTNSTDIVVSVVTR